MIFTVFWEILGYWCMYIEIFWSVWFIFWSFYAEHFYEGSLLLYILYFSQRVIINSNSFLLLLCLAIYNFWLCKRGLKRGRKWLGRLTHSWKWLGTVSNNGYDALSIHTLDPTIIPWPYVTCETDDWNQNISILHGFVYYAPQNSEIC